MDSYSAQELHVLQSRQQAILAKVTQLTAQATEAIAQRTDSSSEAQAQQVTIDVSESEFAAAQKQLNQNVQHLLNVAHTVSSIAKSQNIDLPDKQIVDATIEQIAKDLKSRQDSILSRLASLQEMANSLAKQFTQSPTATEEDTKEDDPAPAFASEEAAVPEDVNPRQNALNNLCKELRNTCTQLDVSEYGHMDVAQFYTALKSLNLVGFAADISELKHIQSVIAAASNADGQILYGALCDSLVDLRGNQSAEMEVFRCDLVGAERKDGKIRIFYRYDGWPEAVKVEFPFETVNQSEISVADVIKIIGINSSEEVTFAQLRYATNTTYARGKRGWTASESDGSIALLVGNDGCVEVDCWLRTQDFLDNKVGKAAPK